MLENWRISGGSTARARTLGPPSVELQNPVEFVPLQRFDAFSAFVKCTEDVRHPQV